MEGAVRIPAEKLAEFVRELLLRLDLPADDAALVARAVVRADLEGVETHGVARLPNYVERLRRGLVKPRPQMLWVRRSGAVALLDADNGMGQVAAARAMAEAIALAREYGTGWVGVRRSNHFGIGSFYVQMAIRAGLVGLAFSNTPPAMAPWGGRQPFLGTNPVAIGIPAGEEPPIVVDFATSAVARGQILKAAREGNPTPPDWAVDAERKPTSDPRAALAGSLLPLGGAKGYALALAVEVLCGVIPGAGVGPAIPSFFDNRERPSDVGHLLVAVNVEAFKDRSEYAARVDRLIRDLRAVPPAAGSAGVRVPGHRRYETAARRQVQGIDLPRSLAAELDRLARELGAPRLPAGAPGAQGAGGAPPGGV